MHDLDPEVGHRDVKCAASCLSRVGDIFLDAVEYHVLPWKKYRLGFVNIEVRRMGPTFLPTEGGEYNICDTDVCVMVPGWEVEIIKLF